LAFWPIAGVAGGEDRPFIALFLPINGVFLRRLRTSSLPLKSGGEANLSQTGDQVSTCLQITIHKTQII
jgi:hypothetical protein